MNRNSQRTIEEQALDWAQHRHEAANRAVNDWAQNLIDTYNKQYTMEWSTGVYAEAADAKAWAVLAEMLRVGNDIATAEKRFMRLVIDSGRDVKAGEPNRYAEAALHSAYIRVLEWLQERSF